MKALFYIFILLFFLSQIYTYGSDVPDDFPGMLMTTLTQDKGVYLPSKGIVRALVIFIQFPDDNFVDNDNWPLNSYPGFPLGADYLADEVDESGLSYRTKSVSDYFYKMSNGLYHVTGYVYPELVYTPNTQEYYESHNYHYGMINREVLQYLDQNTNINFSEFDNWTTSSSEYSWQAGADGKVDMIFMRYRWIDENIETKFGLYNRGIALLSSNYINNLSTNDGVTIIMNGFPQSGVTNQFGARCNYSDITWSLGLESHEFGHYLFGSWHGGPYGGNGLMKDPPGWIGDVGMHSYERKRLGYMDFTDITEDTRVTITDYLTTNVAYRVFVPGSTSEYYVLENRKKLSIYDRPYSTGLVISHITGNSTGCIDIECADGRWNWNLCEGASTPTYYDDDRIYKDTQNPTSGYDGLDNIKVGGKSDFTADINWLCPDEPVEIHGDANDTYQMDSNKEFTPATNPSSKGIAVILRDKDQNNNLIVDIYPNAWGGTISSNTTWDKDIFVYGNINVTNGATLNISSGVTIKFQGYYSITVQSGAKIIANGTQAKRIVFTSATGSSPGSWGYIKLYGGNNVFKYCDFKYGTSPLYLYYCTASEGSRNLFENCNIHHNSSFGIRLAGSLAKIKGCHIYNNYYGMYCNYSSDVDLIGSKIYNNGSIGIYSSQNNLVELYGTVIENNGGYGISTALGDVIHIGKVYSWGSESTIRDNGSHEVYASNSPPNSVEISVASIHDNIGYEIYNYPSNPCLYAQSVYWNNDISDEDEYPCAQTYGPVTIMPSVYCGLPNNTIPPWDNWEGQPHTAGSPIGKISESPLASNKEWFLDPDIPDAEKIEIGKNIIAANPKSAEAKEALRHLYSIIRPDYRENKLGEKGKFFDYLQGIQGKYSKSEIGKRALRYMIYCKMLENNDEAVIKLSNKALDLFTGEEHNDILVNLAITHTHRGELKEAKSILNELIAKCSAEDELVQIVSDDIADIESQMAQGIWEQDKAGKPLPPPEDQPVSSAPDEFTFSTNYPNPFNPITTITFTLPEPSQVRTEVYDLTGRCVAVLCDRSYPVGTYSVQFDGSALASGIYFIHSQMTSTENPDKSQVFTRKMMLMK